MDCTNLYEILKDIVLVIMFIAFLMYNYKLWTKS